MPGNFSYILPGKLAGAAEPGRWSDLRSDLSGLSRQGIGAIVSLTESPLDRSAVGDFGFRYLHLPIRDFGVPSAEQLDEFVAFVNACIGDGVAVAVHCGAGIGRTGTMLAVYLTANGAKPRDAIRQVRLERPGSIETREQEACVEAFYGAMKAKRKKKN